MSKESYQHRTDQYNTAGKSGKVKTPPRRSPPHLSPGQTAQTSTSHKRGQDR